jgi:hypothetical protein
MSGLRKTIGFGSTTLLFAAIMGAASLASAATDKKAAPAPAPAKAAPAAKPATAAARPAGSVGGGVAQRPGAGPSANHPTTMGPSANRPNAITPSANRPSPMGAAGVNGGNRQVQQPGRPVQMPSGPRQQIAPKGVAPHVSAHGVQFQTRPGGQLRQMHDPRTGLDIHHGLNGNRAVSVERADHSRVFAERGRPGFVQRPYNFHGHDFARRTYFYHGRAYSHFYHGFGFRGMYLNVYAPGFYYGPAFYGWAYNPWAAPITFGWGWGGSPWYGYYGGYFAPYPVYPNASYWLTDYMISQDLQAAYAAHQEAGEADGAPSAAGGPPELTPDVKQQIADEVRNQLALENQEAQQNARQQDVDPGSSGIARQLNDAAHGRQHVFVVGTALDVVDASQTECLLSDGDVLALQAAPPDDATAADLLVLSSKGGQECQKRATVSVSLEDLQEMQNHMRESIDQGLQELQARQGKGGIPVAPASPQVTPALYASVAPPQDPGVEAELQQQAQQGDQAEKDVTSDGFQGNAAMRSVAPAAPATVTLGQTQGDVEGILGQPTSKAILGPKVIYNYNGMKVIFKDGKVADVE